MIPTDYSRNLASGKTAQVQLLLDGSDSNTASIALGYAEGVIQAYAQNQREGAQMHAHRQRDPRARRAAQSASGTTPIWCRATSSCRD